MHWNPTLREMFKYKEKENIKITDLHALSMNHSFHIKNPQLLIWITCLHIEKAYVILVPQTKHNVLPNLQIPKKADSDSAKNILTEPQKWWPSIKMIENWTLCISL